MSVTRTYTVTVVSTGSGNKYFIDGVQQDTLNLAESGTFKFDQSNSSNGSHPLRFSTTSDGTHNSGSEYTTGVTTNGTPGSSGAYTQIEVAASAPTLYYYCTNHSGMGGQANTISEDSYGAFGWSSNLWGVKDSFTLGWGAQTWNHGEWGELNDASVSLTSPGAITSSIGSVSVDAQIAVGWGQDGWGVENYGASGLTVEITAPDAIQSNISANAWNEASWGEGQGWGIFSLEVADVMGLTGVSSTSGVGSITNIISATFSLTGVSATSSVGSIDPTQEIVGLTSQAFTSSVGSLSPADVIGVTGVSATSNVGSISIGSSPVVDLTGQAITASVGAIDPLAQVVGLTGQSFTASVGSTTVADLVLGISGVEATVSVAAFGTASGFGIQAYSNIDTGSNTSYTNVATGSNTSYSDVA